MDNEGMVGCFIMAYVGLIFFFMLGMVIGEGNIQCSAVKEGHAHYDTVTREFTWNETKEVK